MSEAKVSRDYRMATLQEKVPKHVLQDLLHKKKEKMFLQC